MLWPPVDDCTCRTGAAKMRQRLAQLRPAVERVIALAGLDFDMLSDDRQVLVQRLAQRVHQLDHRQAVEKFLRD